jgi:DNA replication licensing factor MCM3
MDYLAAFDGALKNMVDVVGASEEAAFDGKDLIERSKRLYHIGLEGSFGEMQVTPRSLNTRYLGKMICIDGIVTTCKSH